MRTAPGPVVIPVDRLDREFNWSRVAECLLDLPRQRRQPETPTESDTSDSSTISIARSIRAA
jgi:hypothetical protein